MENSETTRLGSFYMVSTPSKLRHEGWPLDSLSQNKNSLTYFAETGNNKYDATDDTVRLGEYRKRLCEYLHTALGID